MRPGQNLAIFGKQNNSSAQKAKMEELNMGTDKISVALNKYADRFLMAEVKNFEGAAHKAYADMPAELCA